MLAVSAAGWNVRYEAWLGLGLRHVERRSFYVGERKGRGGESNRLEKGATRGIGLIVLESVFERNFRNVEALVGV